jgi:hypothetical protein
MVPIFSGGDKLQGVRYFGAPTIIDEVKGMDCSLTIEDRRRYEAWLHSPSVYGPDPQELILAYKIARVLHAVPSKALKALRGVAGVDADLVERIEQFVADDANLSFVGQSPNRRVCLLGSESI